MKNRIEGVLAVAMIASMLCAISAAYAYEGGDAPKDQARREGHFKKMTEELKLTPEQQAAITKDREALSEKTKGLREKMKTVRADLKAELDKPVVDTARVNSLVAEMKDLVGTQIQSRVDKIIAMKKILTPEQFKKMEESKKGWKHGNKSDEHGDVN